MVIATRELTKIINDHYTSMQPISPAYMILLPIEIFPAPLIFSPPFTVEVHIQDSSTCVSHKMIHTY